MAFWNTRDDDEAAEEAADELESAATGFAPARLAEAPRNGFYASPLGLIAAAVAVLIVLFLFTPLHEGWWGPQLSGPWFGGREPWIPQGEAVYASQRLADIAAQQEIADARAAAWEDVPAVDAHVGTFAAQTPPR